MCVPSVQYVQETIALMRTLFVLGWGQTVDRYVVSSFSNDSPLLLYPTVKERVRERDNAKIDFPKIVDQFILFFLFFCLLSLSLSPPS